MLRYVAVQRRAQQVSVPSDPVADRYGRFYAPLALAAVLIPFFPLFDDVEEGSSRHSYGTVFDMAGRRGGIVAVIGLLLVGVLVVLLSIAVFRVRSAVLPGALAVVGAVIAWMLVTKPGTGEPTPYLSYAGRAGLVLASCVIVIGAVHMIHLIVLGRDRPGPPVGDPGR